VELVCELDVEGVHEVAVVDVPFVAQIEPESCRSYLRRSILDLAFSLRKASLGVSLELTLNLERRVLSVQSVGLSTYLQLQSFIVDLYLPFPDIFHVVKDDGVFDFMVSHLLDLV